MFRQALANYDTGNFLGTYSADVRSIPATVIEPVAAGARLFAAT
jgi:hypothetical protein